MLDIDVPATDISIRFQQKSSGNSMKITAKSPSEITQANVPSYGCAWKELEISVENDTAFKFEEAEHEWIALLRNLLRNKQLLTSNGSLLVSGNAIHIGAFIRSVRTLSSTLDKDGFQLIDLVPNVFNQMRVSCQEEEQQVHDLTTAESSLQISVM